MLQMRLEVLGDARIEVEISVSPDQLDWNIERSVGRSLCALRFIETFDDTISLQSGEPIDPKDPIELIDLSQRSTEKLTVRLNVWCAALNDYRSLSQKASLARFRASLSWRRGPQPSQTSCTRPAPAHCQSRESAK